MPDPALLANGADLLLAFDGPAQPPGPSIVQSLVLLGAFVLIFYLFLIRPQDQQRKAHDAMVASLKKDDKVVTSSGLYGRIVEVDDKTVVLDVGGKVRLTFDKTSVSSKQGAEAEDKK